ncbi:M23 family metallopeptidase [Clostridium senegalense]
MRKFHKYTIIIVILTVALTTSLTLTFFISKLTSKYVLYDNNKIIAVTSDKNLIKKVWNIEYNEAKNKNLEIKNNLKLKKEPFSTKKDMSKEEIEKSLKNSLKVSSYQMICDDKVIAYVKSKDIGDKAIEIVKNQYISKSKMNNLKNIQLNNNIQYKECECLKNQLKDEVNIANNIINANNEGEKLISFTGTTETFVNTISRGETKVEVNVSKELEEKNESKVENKDETAIVSTKNAIGAQPIFANKSLYVPTLGVISSYFGERWGTVHKGLDIAADTGTPIKAAFSGTVKFSGVMNGYGNVVILEHGNNLETVYAHCDTLTVKNGDKVEKGNQVATVGSTGDSTGPHLHFEVKINGSAVDPLSFSE